jgi:multidrug resistance efflux pump
VRVIEFTVERGAVVDTLHEVGELDTQHPTLLHAPFSGELKWLVQDGTWVEAGDQVLVFNEEDLVRQVTTQRADLVDKQQNLQLARLNADHARIAEAQRVENARQALKLGEIRHRILISEAKGGDELLRLDAKVRPIEEKLTKLQAELKPLEERFRKSRDTYITALQAWQEGRGRLLEEKAGANLNKLSGAAGMKTKDSSEAGGGATKKERKVQKRAAAGAVQQDQTGSSDDSAEEKEPERSVEEEVTELKKALDVARSAHQADRKPYERVLAEVDGVDAEAQELYIQIEIEKRGLPAAQLAIDRDIAKLQLAEAERQVESGKRALAAGAMSQSRVDKLVADAVAAKGRLEILQYRYEIASRPAEEDEVATSEAALATAKRAVDNAQAVYEREMAIHQGQIDLITAQVVRAKGDLERAGKGFAKAIEGTIKMLRTELALLTDEDAVRRREIDGEFKRLERELAEAESKPPHIVLAPSAGLVRLREHDDDLTDIGDRWSRGHTVAMLYPPGNMTVEAGINEVNFQRVKAGMPCRVHVPALNVTIEDAKVKHISQIGRDRVRTKSRWTTIPGSGIIEFELAVDLGRDVEAFRQGMTVHLAIETARRDDVLHLPASAVQRESDGFSVLVDPDRGERKPIQGEFFGDNTFIVTGGLAEGDTIYRIYENGR